MRLTDRWTVRRDVTPSDATAQVIDMARHAADYIEALGPVSVQDVRLSRESCEGSERLTLTVSFDRTQMAVDLDFLDPRMAARFDAGDEPRDDFDFVRALAVELEADTIIDLGCGTGRLATLLAADGRRVIGVDPAPAMLDVARERDGADRVEWVLGDAGTIGTPNADLVVMTGNIALVFTDDAAWDASLRAIHAALRPGGRLAFGSMNPDVHPWERWNTHEMEVVIVEDGRVHVDGHIVFDDGETLVASSEYRLRTIVELTDSLTETGFAIERAYGDWQSSALSSDSPDIVFLARRLDVATVRPPVVR